MPAKFKTINNSEIKIKQINALETIPVRHAVLRKGKPAEACKIPQDNLENTFHFGLFHQKQLVGVCTFVIDQSPYFNDNKQYRLRAMGILKAYQGCTFGKQLLTYGIHFLKEKNIERLWFNARIIAVNFYKNNGFETIGKIFNIPRVGDHYLMHKKL